MIKTFVARVTLDLNELAKESGYKALTQLDCLAIQKMLNKSSIQNDLDQSLKEAVSNVCDEVFDHVLEWADDTEQQENSDRKSTRLNSSHMSESRMPSSA